MLISKTRELVIEDFDEVLKLWERSPGIGISNSDTREKMREFLARNPALSLVYVIADEIVGVLLCGTDGRRGFLYHLAVDERYRRLGIAGKLVGDCIKKLNSIDIDKCHVFVFQENESGAAFWRAMGWEKRDDILVYSFDVKNNDAKGVLS